MIKNFCIWGLVFASLFFVLSPTASAQESFFDAPSSSFSSDGEFLQVDDAFVFNFEQSDGKLWLTFDVADGYYLYRDKFNFKPQKAKISSVLLPEGESHEDEFFGVQQIFSGQLRFAIDLERASNDASVVIGYQGCAAAGLCYPPALKTVYLSEVLGAKSELIQPIELDQPNDVAQQIDVVKSSEVLESSEQHQLVGMLKGDSVLVTLIAFFVGGLLLSFTPCVFPMYPILTGIIVGQGERLSTKRAFTLSFFYVQGMAVTYTLLGIVVALAGAQFQAMFQHPLVLVVLSVLFVFLALSMFGVFNLALPSSWQTKLNQLSSEQKGGSYVGVLMMGAISGLVASPCTTAPLTGALLYISQSGDIWLGASALYALSIGMGLPLLILGSSGSKLLPKAGNWMNIIKNVFGLLLLSVPIILLERFLPVVFIDIFWVLLILSAAGYFYTVNESSAKTFGFGLRSVIIFMMLFFGANKAYEMVYPDQRASASSEVASFEFKQVSSMSEMELAVLLANEQGKTVMVDLYADWCVACKEFEEYTFHDDNVISALSNTVLLQIDLTDTGAKNSIEIMSKLDVFGLPSILFFDLSGEELTKRRVTGFMGADKFSAHVNATFAP